VIDLKRILELLPHRYPFLMLDRVIEIEPGQRAVGIKCVTANEPFFQGHFPGNPVMPGVLIVEALAQTAAVLGAETHPEYVDHGGVLLMGLDKVRFRRPVVPGDTLRLAVELIKVRGPIWRIKGTATVDGERAAQAEMMATFTGEDP
jgi:3-hydroxyacyl-[acyl-carrier-protein] dehydratase